MSRAAQARIDAQVRSWVDQRLEQVWDTALQRWMLQVAVAVDALLAGRWDAPELVEMLNGHPAPRVRSRWLWRSVLDVRLGQPAYALHQPLRRDWRGRWKVTVYVARHTGFDPTGAAGVVHELVEEIFAPAAGFTEEQAHEIATVFEAFLTGGSQTGAALTETGAATPAAGVAPVGRGLGALSPRDGAQIAALDRAGLDLLLAEHGQRVDAARAAFGKGNPISPGVAGQRGQPLLQDALRAVLAYHQAARAHAEAVRAQAELPSRGRARTWLAAGFLLVLGGSVGVLGGVFGFATLHHVVAAAVAAGVIVLAKRLRRARSPPAGHAIPVRSTWLQRLWQWHGRLSLIVVALALTAAAGPLVAPHLAFRSHRWVGMARAVPMAGPLRQVGLAAALPMQQAAEVLTRTVAAGWLLLGRRGAGLARAPPMLWPALGVAVPRLRSGTLGVAARVLRRVASATGSVALLTVMLFGVFAPPASAIRTTPRAIAAVSVVGSAKPRPALAVHRPVFWLMQPGDTLWSVAQRLFAHDPVAGVRALLAANQGVNPVDVPVGYHLRLPAGWNGVWTVAPGDTLSGISARTRISVATLARINHISHPNLIYVGRGMVFGTVAHRLPHRPAQHHGRPAHGRPSVRPTVRPSHTVPSPRRPGGHGARAPPVLWIAAGLIAALATVLGLVLTPLLRPEIGRIVRRRAGVWSAVLGAARRRAGAAGGWLAGIGAAARPWWGRQRLRMLLFGLGLAGRLRRTQAALEAVMEEMAPASGELRAARFDVAEQIERYRTFVITAVRWWAFLLDETGRPFPQIPAGPAASRDAAIRVVAGELGLPTAVIAGIVALPADVAPSPPPELAEKIVTWRPTWQINEMRGRYQEILEWLDGAANRMAVAEREWEQAATWARDGIDGVGAVAREARRLPTSVIDELTGAKHAELDAAFAVPERLIAPTQVAAGPGVSPVWRWLSGQSGAPRGPPEQALADAAQRHGQVRDQSRARQTALVEQLRRAAAKLDDRAGWVRVRGGDGSALPADVLAAALRLPEPVVRAFAVAAHIPETKPDGLPNANVAALSAALTRHTIEVASEVTRLVALVEQAQQQAREADARYAEAMAAHIQEAFWQRVPADRIARLTGLTRIEIDRITRRYTPNPATRTPFVDRWLLPLIRTLVLAVFKQPAEFGFQRGRVDLAPEFATLDPSRADFPAQVEALQKKLGTELPFTVVRSVGHQRRDFRMIWDVHFHIWGYDVKVKNTVGRLVALLEVLEASGHLGVIVISPIPQRGVGTAANGGAWYYLTNVIKLVMLFGVRTLTMSGKRVDILLAQAIRQLPPHLRWRVKIGISGARVDRPGTGAFVKLMLILFKAIFLAETTLMKEAVTRSLGRQAGRILTGEYERAVGQMVGAARMVKQELAASQALRARVAGLPGGEGLRKLFPADGSPSRLNQREFLQALKDNHAKLVELLLIAGRTREASAVLAAAEHMAAPFNPFLLGLLYALAETGQVLILHSDMGQAPVEADGLYTEGPVDERYLMPMLALLASDSRLQKVRIIWAHLGVGTFTEVTLEHFDWLDFVLEHFESVRFDVSWNELIRHVMKHPDLQERFIRFVLEHQGRILLGSDVVSPESLAHYLRHHHDIEPLLAAIEARPGGVPAVRWLEYKTAGELRRQAQRDGEQFVFNEVAWMLEAEAMMASTNAEFRERGAQQYASSWGPVFARLPTYLRRAVLARHEDMLRAGMEGTAPGTGPGAGWENNRELTDALRWLKAIDVTLAKGDRATVAVRLHALLVAVRDLRRDLRLLAIQRRAERAARRGLDPAVTADGLLAEDVTTATLIAAEQAGMLHESLGIGGPQLQDNLTKVRRTVERTERTQINNDAGLARLRTRLTVDEWVGHSAVVAVHLVLVGLLAAGLIPGTGMPAAASVLSVAGLIAFVVRPVITLLRLAPGQYLRAVHDAILERALLPDPRDVTILAAAAAKFARHELTSPDRLDKIHTLLRQLVFVAAVAAKAQLGSDESAADRDRTLSAVYSLMWDKIKAAAGMLTGGVASFLNPNAGLSGKIAASIIALTWEVNAISQTAQVLFYAVPGSMTWWANLFFAPASLAFFAALLPVAINGWSGVNSTEHPVYRRLQQLVGFPLLFVANTLLFLQVPSTLLSFAAFGLAVGSFSLARLGVDAETGSGRQPAREGASANFVVQASLMGYALVALGDRFGSTPWLIVPGAISVIVAIGYRLLERAWDLLKSPASSGKERWQRRLDNALQLLIIGSGVLDVADHSPAIALAFRLIALAAAITMGTRVFITHVIGRSRQRRGRGAARTWQHPERQDHLYTDPDYYGPDYRPDRFRPETRPRPTTGGGSLAVGLPGNELGSAAKRTFEGKLTSVRLRRRLLDWLRLRTRGPPLRFVPANTPGFAGFADQVIAYTWYIDESTPVVVMFAKTYQEIRALRRYGLARDFLQQVLAYEQRFRIIGGDETVRLAESARLISSLNEARVTACRVQGAVGSVRETAPISAGLTGVLPGAAGGGAAAACGPGAGAAGGAPAGWRRCGSGVAGAAAVMAGVEPVWFLLAACGAREYRRRCGRADLWRRACLVRRPPRTDPHRQAGFVNWCAAGQLG